jgi:hypothetical protein
MHEERNSTRTRRIFVGKLDGRRLLEIPRRRWEDNSKTNLKETAYVGVDWTRVT